MNATAPPAAADRLRFYRAEWRWHFYAGLFVVPFIAWLALTGAVYLYQKPIDGLVHAGLKLVEPAGKNTALPSADIAAAGDDRGRCLLLHHA